MIAVGFVLAAAMGAVLRHVVVATVAERGHRGAPLGVAAVNVAGSLLLGVLVGLRIDGTLSGEALTVLGTGLCGALTTWSGFALDATTMATDDSPARATAYVAGSVVVGFGAAAVGLAVTGAL